MEDNSVMVCKGRDMDWWLSVSKLLGFFWGGGNPVFALCSLLSPFISNIQQDQFGNRPKPSTFLKKILYVLSPEKSSSISWYCFDFQGGKLKWDKNAALLVSPKSGKCWLLLGVVKVQLKWKGGSWGSVWFSPSCINVFVRGWQHFSVVKEKSVLPCQYCWPFANFLSSSVTIVFASFFYFYKNSVLLFP